MNGIGWNMRGDRTGMKGGRENRGGKGQKKEKENPQRTTGARKRGGAQQEKVDKVGGDIRYGKAIDKHD